MQEGVSLTYHEYELEMKTQLKQKIFYKKGKKEGKYFYYDENGLLREEGHFVEGRLEGEYFQYLKDGKLKERRIYKYGTLINIVK